MSNPLPTVLHTYQNHTLDSTRWNHYIPRADDIIVATAYKSGTTWTLGIVRQLILLGQAVPPFDDLWIEARFEPPGERITQAEDQQHRRFIKTHLPLDGLPFYPQVKYIVVGRDPHDVFMSLWNHYANHTVGFYAFINDIPDRVGAPFPVCAQDIHAFWREWITRGWFAWESEGYPYWGNLHHTQTWWNYRHLDNIFFVHYNDLLADLAGEIGRIARFLNIEIPDQSLPALLEAVSLASMRSEAEKTSPGMEQTWHGGARTFFFKGTNGRWSDVLVPEELLLYEQTASRALTSACRRWLEQGRAALT